MMNRRHRWRLLTLSLVAICAISMVSCSDEDPPPTLPDEDTRIADVSGDQLIPTDRGDAVTDRGGTPDLIDTVEDPGLPDLVADTTDIAPDRPNELDILDVSEDELLADLADAADDGGSSGGLVLSSLGFGATASVSLSDSFTFQGRISASIGRSTSSSWSLVGGF